MAIKSEILAGSTRSYEGLSTDPKPGQRSGYPPISGDTFYETDTLRRWVYSGGVWLRDNPPLITKLLKTCLYGDSILAGGSPTVTGVTVTSSGGIATVAGATSHGMGKGGMFFMARANEKSVNGHFPVNSRISSSSFTYLARDGETFPEVATSTGSGIQFLRHGTINDRSWVQLASAMLSNPFGQIINCSVSGVTAAFLLANIDDYLWTQNPDSVHVLCGVNDVTNNDSEANIANYILGILDSVVAKRRLCFWYPMLPLGPSASGYTIAMAATLMRVNRRVSQEIKYSLRDVIPIDVFSAAVDASSNTLADWLSTLSADDKHPNALGARKFADLLVTAATNRLAPNPKGVSVYIDDVTTDSASRQLARNPIMYGTAGTKTENGGSGTITGGTNNVPDNWTLVRNGTLSVAPTTGIVRSDGRGYDFQMVASGALNSDVFDLIGASIHASVAAGDLLTMEIHVRGTSISGVSNIRVYFEMVCDGVTYTITALQANGATNLFTTDFDYTLVAPLEKIPMDAASITVARPRVQVNFGGAGGGTFLVGCCEAEKVVLR